MQTVFGAQLARHARDAPDRAAFVTRTREHTYAELASTVQGVAAWLAEQGCGPEDLVGISIADEVTHLVASVALLVLGIPQVVLSTREPVAMRLDLARRLAVRAVLATDPQHALPGTRLLLKPEAIDAHVPAAPVNAVQADAGAPAIYFTSSGTTGAPKIFALSQLAIALRSERLVLAEHVGHGYRTLTCVHVDDFPAKQKRLNCLYLGVASAFASGPSATPVALPALCAALRVTCLELNVLQLGGLVSADATDIRFPAGMTAFVSGTRVPAALRDRFRKRFGQQLYVHYGAREFGRIATTFPRGDDEGPEAVGTPYAWVGLQIVDVAGTVLPPGKVGYVRVRADGMIHEYFQDPIATARHYKGGWFYPGDMGSLTPGGALCIHGRADDMMNLNGIKIFPAEIERVLEEHRCVGAAAAFAWTSSVHGEIPVAAVELQDGDGTGVEELMAYARERLGTRGPRRIFVLERLPRNLAGKVLKRELVDLVRSRT